MRYFEFGRNNNRKVVGKNYCQTSEVFDLDFKKGIPFIDQLSSLPNYLGKLDNSKFPDVEPRVKFQLNSGSKQTDLINIINTNSRGLFISNRLKGLMENFNLMEHKFYSGELFIEEKPLLYYWFHPVVEDLKWIDFSKSVFSIMDAELIIKEVDQRVFESEKNYQNFRLNNKNNIQMKTIFLNKEFFKDLDFFYLPGFQFGYKYFISNELKLEMEKKKISGVAFKSQTYINDY